MAKPRPSTVRGGFSACCFKGVGRRRKYSRPKKKGVITAAAMVFHTASEKWRDRKDRRSAVAAANSASAEANTGTRTASRATAPAVPSTKGRMRLTEPLCFFGSRAATTAHRWPNSPHSSRQNRSHSMAGRHQGSRCPPERPTAWMGSSASRASRFHTRKYQLEPRVSVAASTRFVASKNRLSPATSSLRP